MIWKNDLSDLPPDVQASEVLFAWKVEERLRKDPAEDLPEAYVIQNSPVAISGIVIYGKWRGHWQANPFSVRGLVRKLLGLMPSSVGSRTLPKLTIEVHSSTGDPSFIYAVYGPSPLHALAAMESELNNPECVVLHHGPGDYCLEPSWVEPQIGDHGREELPGYWDFRILEFRPVDTSVSS